MKLELENNLLLNENKNEIIDKQNNFFKTTVGIAVNGAIDYGLKKILPDFLEDQVIEVKDALLNNGIKEGINTAIDKVMDLGKSVTGIFTGDFKKVSQLETVVKRGGLIDEFSKLFDKSLENIKDKDYISRDISNILKNSKDIIEKSLDDNISAMLKEQNKIINDIDICIENWNKYKTEKDFEKMDKEYQKIQEQIEKVIPLEETIQKLKELENLHTLIKNNGHNFNLTEKQMELARMV